MNGPAVEQERDRGRLILGQRHSAEGHPATKAVGISLDPLLDKCSPSSGWLLDERGRGSRSDRVQTD